MLSIGIDVSKGKSTVCGMKPGGEIVYAPFEVQHTREGMSELSRTDEIILNLKYAVRRAAGSVIQWYGLDTSSVIVEQAPLVIPSAHENEKRIQRAK